MSKRILAPLVGLLAFGLVAAGCGSSDDGTDTTATATITKAELIKKADAICAAGNKANEEAAEEAAEEAGFKLEDATDEQLRGLIADIVVPGVREQAEEIASLGAPEGDEDQVAAVVAAVEEGVDALEADPNEALEGEPFSEASELAGEYGFKVCGAE